MKIIYQYKYFAEPEDFKEWQESNNVTIHKMEFDNQPTTVGLLVIYSEVLDEIPS